MKFVFLSFIYAPLCFGFNFVSQSSYFHTNLRYQCSNTATKNPDNNLLTLSVSKKRTEPTPFDDVSINPNPELMQTLYQQWEEDFKAEIQEEENEKSISDEDDMENDLPDYMIKLISKYDDGALRQEMDPVPAGKLPTIAIIGRPNTGKSTIVNKLSDTYKDGAIIHDEPGITRDRTYRTGMWNGYNFQIVDTGGIVFDDNTDIFSEKITQQALQAIRESNVAVMVVDGKEGMTQLDEILAEWLRKNNKLPVYVAVNKCESETQGNAQAQEFWQLGLGEPYPVSGIHGTGLGDLLDVITTRHMTKLTNVLKENATNVAFIGRPNVGKSSLFNRLYGEERSIVSDIAGTTRDTVDALLVRKGVQYRIIDTAGVRKRGKIEYGPEYFMVNRAFKAIRRSEVVVLLLDAIDGIVEQDRLLAERIVTEGRACVICLNKWDIVPNKDDKTYIAAIENVRSTLPALKWAEVLLVSAKTGQRTDKLFDAIDKSAKQFSRRIPTAILNEIVQEATLWMAPPTIGARSGRIYYSIQTSTAPPTLVMFCNDPALFTENYKKYLERKIRDGLNFEGTPIKMFWRGKTLRDVGRAARKGDAVTGRITGGGALGGGRPGSRIVEKGGSRK